MSEILSRDYTCTKCGEVWNGIPLGPINAEWCARCWFDAPAEYEAKAVEACLLATGLSLDDLYANFELEPGPYEETLLMAECARDGVEGDIAALSEHKELDEWGRADMVQAKEDLGVLAALIAGLVVSQSQRRGRVPLRVPV